MRFLLVALAIFLIWSYAEVTLLLLVAHRLGVLAALGLTIATGVAGIAVARTQGWRLVAKIRRDFSQGDLPVESLLDGGLLIVAGVLLLIPGLISDFFGVLLLIPWIRRLLLRLLARRWIDRRQAAPGTGTGQVHRFRVLHDGDVIDSVTLERRREGGSLDEEEDW